MECSDTSNDENFSYGKDDDQWTKYIKIEYEKIVKNFNVKKAKDIKYIFFHYI
jgi:hypothetical protein